MLLRGAAAARGLALARGFLLPGAHLSLVKDERHYDRFDRVFAEHFAGAERRSRALERSVPARLAGEPDAAPAHRRGKAARRGARRLGEAARDAARSAWRSSRSGTRAAANGSAPAGTSPFGHTATTPRASASAVRRASGARSRCGSSASSATSTTRSSSAPAISSWRCASCAGSRARARPRNSISTTPSMRPRATPACSI